ncbi:hypothetical protein [Amycolatopsis sp. NPDC051102]|uniref:hypothetical protein n=1 Tax=Amycolatopsis sp. NPDC051102 TaxID=3155163 RepID=UPI003447DC72
MLSPTPETALRPFGWPLGIGRRSRCSTLSSRANRCARRLFHQHQSRVGIVAFSGRDLQLSAEQLKSMGITELLIKGGHIQLVLDAVRRAARNADLP